MLSLLALLACQAPSSGVDASAEPIPAYDPLDYVDPLMATGGPGAQVINVNPGATVPFGMTYVGPDTRASNGSAIGALHCGGYHYDDTHIGGVSHTHSLGMGVPDYGTVTVMPKTRWDPEFTRPSQRMAAFSHDDETARPGSYAVRLADGIEVRIAATQRGALHEWVFEDTTSPTVLVDLAAALGDNEVTESRIEIAVESGEITGFQRMHGAYSERFGGLQTWFAATVEPPPVGAGTWTADAVSPGVLAVSAAGGSGAWLSFPPGTERVTLRLAIAYTDAEGAWSNLEAELAGRDLAEVEATAEEEWRELLSRVRLRGSERDKRIFHSAHYRTSIMPSRFTDVDGRYRGVDDEIHALPSGLDEYYTDFSLWDTFRTTHSWFLLTDPDRQADMLQSLALMTEQGGSVPRWPLAHGYTGGMIGTPADLVFAESWLKGVRDFDHEAVFAACLDHARSPQPQAGRAGVLDYVERGYVSFEAAGQPASRTLEYAWADHALALWAESLGRAEEVAWLAPQSENWRNSWDADQGWFIGRYADGSFAPVVDPKHWTDSYVEGNSWHYRWGVPWDVPALVEVQHDGDQAAFLSELDAYWTQVYAEPDDAFPDDFYWHGNEPDLHYAYLGALAGAPDHSADPIRWILEHRYDDGPHGLDGNDDGGTLSAWYLFSSLGLYPVAGTADYVVGSPIFERAEIDRPEGTLVLRMPGTSHEARYLSSVYLADDAHGETLVAHDQLVGAGEIVLSLTSEPGGWP